jgi:histone H3/H4
MSEDEKPRKRIYLDPNKRAKGDRWRKRPTYIKKTAGKNKRRHLPGTVAKRRAHYMRTTNGLVLRPTDINRVVKVTMDEIAPVLEKERIATLDICTELGVPTTKKMNRPIGGRQGWNVQQSARQLLRAAGQAWLERNIALATTLRKHRNRKKLLAVDIDTALRI